MSQNRRLIVRLGSRPGAALPPQSAAAATTRLAAAGTAWKRLDNGVPIALLCAAADATGRDGSFNIQIPLKAPK